jgi:hypothetical protein
METTADLYPEHTKLMDVKDESQAIGEFIDWLASKRMALGEWREFDGYDNPQFVPAHVDVNAILAEHFGIDLANLETEKREMLAVIRAANA